MIYAADFETATTEPTYVWAWGVESLDEENFQCGTDIESFFILWVHVRVEQYFTFII